jgi:serine/threonine protein phosphatase PrpC
MHERSGAPNQDAVATGLVDGGGLVIALADGHGASRHVRSDRGAAIAVEFAIEQARSAVFARHSAEHPLVAATDRILAGWRARVLDDYQARPFTEQERRRAGVDLDDAPLIAYGATLLISVLAADQVHLAQIGDGDIVVVTEQGGVTTPVPGDSRLVADETTSLCGTNARADFRFATVPKANDATVVVLATDGYGLAFADANWRQTVGRDLLGAIRESGLDGVANQLPGWLADSARVGGDDVTVAIAARQQAR